MGMVNFKDMEKKFGQSAAYHWLGEIEKAARTASRKNVLLDPQTRLDIACRAQDEQAPDGDES